MPTLTKHSNTIKKLHLYHNCYNDSPFLFSFVGLFSNLEEIILSTFSPCFEDFKKLQYVNFPKLQILKIPFDHPKPEYMMKFLENNGKGLKQLYMNAYDNALSLSIANFCPNLKSLFVRFKKGEADILKTIFINCQYLESIKIWCGKNVYLTVGETFETVANYSKFNFCELTIYNHFPNYDFISPEKLESFFISWKNRMPKKSLKLIFVDYVNDEENMKIIEKYENLGIIKFETKTYEKLEEEGEVVAYY